MRRRSSSSVRQDLFGEVQTSAQPELVGLRGYAQHRGCRQREVQDAIARGVLRESVHVRGDRRMLDLELADREWVASNPEAGGPLGRAPITAGETVRAAKPGTEGPTPMGVRAYARHRGVAEGAVRDAIARGRLRKSVRQVGRRRLIDPAIADAEWDESTDVEASERGAQPKGAGRNEGRSFIPDSIPGGEGREARSVAKLELLQALDAEDEAETNAVFMTERAARERWARRRERLEVLKLRGELIEKGEVDRRAFTAARVVRDALKGLPDRLAPVLAPAMPAGDVGRILEREIAQALEEIGAQLRGRVQATAS